VFTEARFATSTHNHHWSLTTIEAILKRYNFSLFSSNRTTHFTLNTLSLLWYFTLDTICFSHWTHFHFEHFVNKEIFTLNFKFLPAHSLSNRRLLLFILNRHVCCTLWECQTFLDPIPHWFHTKVRPPQIVCSHHPVLMKVRSCD